MTECAKSNLTDTFEEIAIPTPWGAITVRTKGGKKLTPVLLLHGIQDNACSFDSLISLLPQAFYFVSADLPGHGKSNPFAEGLILEFSSYILCIKRIIEFFSWNKCYIIGHSLGAQLAFIFSSVYPEIVVNVIMIDGFVPFIVPPENSPTHFRLCIKELEKVEFAQKTRQPPSYTYDEAFNKIKSNRKGSLKDHSAEILLKRSLIQSGTGYRFITDQRLKYFIKPFYTMDYIQNVVSHVKCPVLLILADYSVNNYSDVLGDYFHIILNKMFFKKPNIRIVVVSGDHNVHINFPERLFEHVMTFLLPQCSI